MFKLVVLSALVAVAVAKPSGLLEHSAVVAAPIAYSIPSAVSHTYRQDVISKPAVVATYAAAAPIVAEAPLVYSAPVVATKALYAPAAVSSSYRQDIVSKPLVATYAAPAYIAHAPSYVAHAPALGYATHPW